MDEIPQEVLDCLPEGTEIVDYKELTIGHAELGGGDECVCIARNSVGKRQIIYNITAWMVHWSCCMSDEGYEKMLESICQTAMSNRRLTFNMRKP